LHETSPARCTIRLRRFAALVFCAPSQVACSVIGGQVVVRDGQLTTVDLGPVIEQHNRLAQTLFDAAR
jgi:8-oxoguanine deaminase